MKQTIEEFLKAGGKVTHLPDQAPNRRTQTRWKQIDRGASLHVRMRDQYWAAVRRMKAKQGVYREES